MPKTVHNISTFHIKMYALFFSVSWLISYSHFMKVQDTLIEQSLTLIQQSEYPDIGTVIKQSVLKHNLEFRSIILEHCSKA